MRSRICVLISVLATIGFGCASAKEIFVSPIGSDAGDGSRRSPLASLDFARDRARSAGSAAVITLLPGDYYRQGKFELSARDAGLTIRSSEPYKARLISGTRIAPGAFKAVTDPAILQRADPVARGHLVELDLAAITPHTIKPPPDLFMGNGGMIDLYIDSQRQPLSRWPNANAYVTMARVIDSGLVPQPHGGTFVYRGDRPGRWTTALSNGGIWLVGYWRAPWIAHAIRVQSIDPKNNSITFAAAAPNGIGSKYSEVVNGSRIGDGKEPWYAMNLLEEIDTPGEWCVDFSTRKLYLWPPSDLGGAGVVIADSSEPIIAIDGAHHLRLEGLTLFGGIKDAIDVSNSSHLHLAGLNITGAGQNGINVVGGQDVKIQSCNVANTGGVGINVNGGDRKTLAASHYSVINNHVHHTGTNDRSTYAMSIDGVGVYVANNLVHDAPLGGIRYLGNDHLFEFNEIHNLGLEGGDLGGFYVNGDWAGCNNTIRYNLVHHSANANGVYLDDGRSGDIITDNIMYKTRAGVFVSGGHDNIVKRNVIVDVNIGLHVDDRGKARDYTRGSKGALTNFLNTLDMTAEPWKSRYPRLNRMLAEPDRLPLPMGNLLSGNIMIQSLKLYELINDESQVRRDNAIQDNIENPAAPSAVFADPAMLRFELRDTAANLESIKAIPLDRIGLKKDEYRRELPTDEQTGRFSPRQPRTIFDSEQDMQKSNEQAKQKH